MRKYSFLSMASMGLSGWGTQARSPMAYQLTRAPSLRPSFHPGHVCMESCSLRQVTRKDVTGFISFSVATNRNYLANYHKLGGLKQHTFIFFLFWRPEVQSRFHRCWQG